MVKDEVLSSYQPVNVWGFTSPFAGRHKTGIATLDDMINFIKHRKEAEVQLMKGLQKVFFFFLLFFSWKSLRKYIRNN